MSSSPGYPWYRCVISSWEKIWRNVAFHHMLTNGSSAVNGCRQNDSQHHNKQWFKDKKNISMMDLYLTNTWLLASQDGNWWTGVVWITYGLLWCFYQLSFWRHPFTPDDPLVKKWWNATFLSKSDEEINSSTSWMAWVCEHFSVHFHSDGTHSLHLSFIVFVAVWYCILDFYVNVHSTMNFYL